MEVKCDKCGDVSNSLPGLICGRVKQDRVTLKILEGPCLGTYWIVDG